MVWRSFGQRAQIRHPHRPQRLGAQVHHGSTYLAFPMVQQKQDGRPPREMTGRRGQRGVFQRRPNPQRRCRRRMAGYQHHADGEGSGIWGRTSPPGRGHPCSIAPLSTDPPGPSTTRNAHSAMADRTARTTNDRKGTRTKELGRPVGRVPTRADERDAHGRLDSAHGVEGCSDAGESACGVRTNSSTRDPRPVSSRPPAFASYRRSTSSPHSWMGRAHGHQRQERGGRRQVRVGEHREALGLETGRARARQDGYRVAIRRTSAVLTGERRRAHGRDPRRLMVVVTGQRLARDPGSRLRALRARPVVYPLLVAIGRLVSQRVIGRRVESDRE